MTPDAFRDLLKELRQALARGELELVLRTLQVSPEITDPDVQDAITVLSSRLDYSVKRLNLGNLKELDYQSLRSEVSQGVLNVLRVVQDASATGIRNVRPQPQGARRVDEAIVGDNRLFSMGWLYGALVSARAVCKIETPKKRASGFHISSGWILTNRHVLDDASTAASSTAIFGYEENESGQTLPGDALPLDAAEFRTATSLDCVRVRVQTAWSPRLERAPDLRCAKNEPSVGDYVSIIQHPSGGPKRIAFSENQVTGVTDTEIKYQTDTLPGSSGAPVFNDAWQLVAIHKGSRFNPDGRKYENVGVRIASALAELGIPIDGSA